MERLDAQDYYDEAESAAERWVNEALPGSVEERERVRRLVAQSFLDRWKLGNIVVGTERQGNFTVVTLWRDGELLGLGASKRRPRGWSVDVSAAKKAAASLSWLLPVAHKAVMDRDWAFADGMLVDARGLAFDALQFLACRERSGDKDDPGIGVRAALPHAVRKALNEWMAPVAQRVFSFDALVPATLGPCEADADSSATRLNDGTETEVEL